MIGIVEVATTIVVFALDGFITAKLFSGRPKEKTVTILETQAASPGWGEDRTPGPFDMTFSRTATGVGKIRTKTVTVNLTKQEIAWINMKRSVLTLASVFSVDFLIFWGLTHIGGPLSGGVDGIVKKFGGSVTIATAGTLGAYLVLVVISLLALKFIKNMMP